MADTPPPRMVPGERVAFVPDRKSFRAFMLSDQMRDVTNQVAHGIAGEAGRLAPRRRSGITPDGAAMADQFKVKKAAGILVINDGGHANPRVRVEVYNEARSAAPNEFGGKKNKRHRMLGRAGALFGNFRPKGGPA